MPCSKAAGTTTYVSFLKNVFAVVDDSLSNEWSYAKSAKRDPSRAPQIVGSERFDFVHSKPRQQPLYSASDELRISGLLWARFWKHQSRISRICRI